MCGIVGLFLKDEALEPELGRHLARMLITMTDRGPDSAGFAVYGAAVPGTVKISVRAAPGTDDLSAAIKHWSDALGVCAEAVVHQDQAVIALPEEHAAEAVAAVRRDPALELVGAGHRMELFKAVGRPETVSERFGLTQMRGSHGIGHTRMATESAVTTDGAHPFSTGLDQCLVHNGSLSNHNMLRRRLVRAGLSIDTKNDSEVGAAYLTWRMAEGMSLGEALEASLDDLDGFFTFVVGTEKGFGVLRDPIACKPAVMAETERYVAFGSEYRALAGLPDIAAATVWEPEPARVYFWERAA